MLVGYNTNINYKGKTYHVQTEDSGIKNPFIITLLYLQGTILASNRISYAELASRPDYKKNVRELMKEQHKSMIKELISGKYSKDDNTEIKNEISTLEQNEKLPEEPPQKEQTLDSASSGGAA